MLNLSLYYLIVDTNSMLHGLRKHDEHIKILRDLHTACHRRGILAACKRTIVSYVYDKRIAPAASMHQVNYTFFIFLTKLNSLSKIVYNK